MILREDLFVIKDNKRYRLDLNTPSGITLNFKSNLFGDLSKINCSYSYTFRLPMTLNNRLVMDNAEDIRLKSNMIRKRLKAEFYQNGINLFSNANLYISEISDTYSAVLTWDVNDSLEKLKDHDISLNELGLYIGDKMVWMYENEEKSAEESFDNTVDMVRPMYNCGFPFYKFETAQHGRDKLDGSLGDPRYFTYSKAYPLPVVPVYRLLKAIEEHFGMKCKLGSEMKLGEFSDAQAPEDIITKGVIPLVSLDIYYEELEKCRYKLDNPTPVSPNVTSCELEVKSLLTFDSISVQGGNALDFLRAGGVMLWKSSTEFGPEYSNVGLCPEFDLMKFEYDGCVTAGFDFGGDDLDLNENPPTLSVVQMQTEYIQTFGGGRAFFGIRNNKIWKELGSVEGEQIGNYNAFIFDFSSINGCERIECSDVQAGYTTCFVFNYKVTNFKVDVPITAHLLNADECITNHPISLFYNLPDISCLTFIKSLFYMIGAYPSLNELGELVPLYYTEIEKNLLSKNYIDWSTKDTSSYRVLPDEIRLQLSDFAQNNYYLMKSDNIEEKSREKKEEYDIYADGMGILKIDNEIIDKEKTVIQLPFYAPYIKNKKFPMYETGDTMKAWSATKEEQPSWWNTNQRKMAVEFCNPYPCYGIIKNRMRKHIVDGEELDYGNIMTMEVWNGFNDLVKNSALQYLQKIISDPYVITVKLQLNEFDLRDLDYSVPVYLTKYNSYFCVVSVQRDTNGNCKCELIKLPN